MIKSIGGAPGAALILVCLCAPLAQGLDEWGYEDVPAPKLGISAGPALSLSGAHSAKGRAAALTTAGAQTVSGTRPLVRASIKEARTSGPRSAKPASQQAGRLQARALPPHDPPAGRNERAVQTWMKLYTFVSEQNLTDELKSQIRDNLKSRLDSPRAPEVTGILEFWPRVESATAASTDQKDNYKSLLRSLLRFQGRKASAAGSQDSELISAVLGPTRIAAPGSPPLTEEAVEAYADMACFLYEQSHPGKTVNALDNRMVFASVIRSKFIEAPTAKDRDAMANFDLSWAKFKILWTGADERGRQMLLAAWTHKNGTAGGAKTTDPTVEAVLHNGPWSEPN